MCILCIDLDDNGIGIKLQWGLMFCLVVLTPRYASGHSFADPLKPLTGKVVSGVDCCEVAMLKFAELPKLCG